MSRRTRQAGRAVALTAALALASPGAASAQGEPVPSAVATGTQYAVATESPYAARAAFDVLASGGSAIDAAIAAVLDLGVTYQDECGLGGGGFLVHRSAGGDVRTIDFREKSAQAPYSDGVMNRSIEGSTGETGHDVIGVPGTLAGLALAHDLGGRLPWASLFEAAIRDARDGYLVSSVSASVLKRREQDIKLFAETSKIYLESDGTPYDFEDVHVQPDLAATLARLATRTTEEAREEFYRSGTTARLLLAEFTRQSPYHEQGDDSPIEDVDLREYEALLRPAVVSEYRGHQVIGMGPPTSGGIAVAEILNILEGDDLEAASHADRIHLLAEAQKVAFADRAKWVGDPDHVRIPVAELTSQPYADTRRAEIRLDKAQSYEGGSFDGYDNPSEPSTTNEGPQTTHVSIVGRNGEAVAVSCSLEVGLGSAVVAADTGILLNGQLHDFDEHAPDGAANAYEADKRPRSSMSPTIVVRDGEVMLAAGSQGGPKIIMAVLQAVQSVVDAGLTAGQAIDPQTRPRVNVHNPDPLPTALMVEYFPYTADGAVVFGDLLRRGHLRIQAEREADPEPATVSAVSVARDGTLTAANDQRPWPRLGAKAALGSRAR